ncbi:MAG: M48 family metalloprotease [Thermoplasmata archaeon]|nr:M48 family metalloprotease [Thermoplasmata archaeon]
MVVWLMATGFALLAGFLGPVVLLPAFYRVERVEDPGIADRVGRLAERAGVRTLGVFQFRSGAKTERETAALAGLGRTRRILLSDHILKDYSAREVVGILAHELAHHVRRDPVRFIVLGAAGSLLGLALLALLLPATMGSFGIARLEQVATLPLFVTLGLLIQTALGPVQRFLSRRREGEADRRGALLCGDPEALAAALVKLHDRNLSDAFPPRWVERLFYSHPAGGRRVRRLLDQRNGMINNQNEKINNL